MSALTSKHPSSPAAPGTRPPSPPITPQLRLIVWLLLCASCALLWFQSPLLAWATHLLAVQPKPAADMPRIIALASMPPAIWAARSLATLLAPPAITWLQLGAAGGLVLLALELALRIGSTFLQQRSERRASRIILRVRGTPLRPGEAADPLRDVDLLRALHTLMPAAPLATLIGRAPWLTLLLHARPGEPVELGIIIAGGAPGQGEVLAQAVRATLTGHAPGALVETVTDPFPTELHPMSLMAWQQFRLSGPVELPLRTLEDVEGDPLATLASALRPTATVYTELHIALRPLRGWALTEGWRAAGLRRLLRLQQKADHALSPDAKRLETRLALPAFAAEMRAIAVAHGSAARTTTATALTQIADVLRVYAERTGGARQGIIAAGGGRVSLSTPAGAQRLENLLARPAPRASTPGLLLPRSPAHPSLLLTVADLVSLWHLPTAPLAGLVQAQACRHIPPPRHVVVPPIAVALPHRDGWVSLGLAHTPDGQRCEVGLTLSDLRYVLHLTAGMGTGKSRLLANLCRQLIDSGFCLIDGKGDDVGSLAMTVLQRIPLGDEARVAILDPRDARWPVGINPLAGLDLSQPGAVDQVVANVFGLFARIDPETWGAAQGMRDFLDKGLRLVLAAEPHPTLANIKQCLLDEGYRTSLLERCHNRDVTDYWTAIFPRLAESQRTSRDALLRRFDKLLSADLLRLMVTQPQPALHIGTAIARRSILVVPIPNVALGDLAGLYAMLMFQQFLRAAFIRPGDDQSRVDYPLIIDELQVLIAEAANDDIETALSRLRSLAVPLVIAHQALTQLGPVEPLVQINAENRIILKTREPDASAYARQYGHGGLTAGDIANQDPNEHQYAVLRCAGKPAGPFSMAPLSWPKPLAETLPTYDGPPWQTVVPAQKVSAGLDAFIAQFAYEDVPAAELDRRAEQLSLMPEELFALLMTSWEKLRAAHLAQIAAHPGCIPDKLERIRWRSRLRYGMPYVLAEALYRRARPAIAAEAPPEGRRRGGAAPAGAKGASPDTTPPEPPPFTQADRQPPPRSPRATGPLFPADDDEG